MRSVVGAWAVVLLLLALAAVATGASGAIAAPIHQGCPPGNVRWVGAATVDQVVAIARARVVGTVTRVQGRTYRYTRRNTPVEVVVMYVGFSAAPGGRLWLNRAKHRCGTRLAPYASVVSFGDALSLIAGTKITTFVVKTDHGWWTY